MSDSTYLHKAFNIIYTNYSEFSKKAELLMEENRGKFTLKDMTKKFDDIMEKHMKNSPQQVNLKLPKLKKVDKSKMVTPDIKLPKLNKVMETANENN